MPIPTRTFLRHGAPYTTWGSGVTTPTPTKVLAQPAVVTASTYIPPHSKKPQEPRDVTPDEIFAELSQLTVKPRRPKQR